MKNFFAILLVYLLLMSCHSCPDLAMPAFLFNYPTTFDSSQLRITINSDKKTLKKVDLNTLMESKEGRYNMVFYYSGNLIGELNEISTIGARKGCEAEKIGTEAIPLIEFLPMSFGKWQVRLIRNGKYIVNRKTQSYIKQ